MPWNSLGTVVPSFLEWRMFNSPAIGGKVFRVTFLGDIDNVNSYCLLRSRWANGEISQATRLYPTPEKQLLELPEAAISDPAYTVRDFQIRKFWKRRRFYGYARDSAWQVKLEEY